MELNNSYLINIIGQSESNENCSFVAVELLSSNSSKYYRDYYNKLSEFNKCGDWFGKLDYPVVEVGQIVVAQINEKKNIWARGIITNITGQSIPLKLYLIDSQRFADNDKTYSLRNCPSKFENLILPTYNIDVNFCLKNDNLKIINKLIAKNQYGELSFSFTPKSIQNNVYIGEIVVNSINDCSCVPLKKMLKNIHSLKYFDGISGYINQLNTFNPLSYSHLQNIFIPRDPYSIINIDKCEHYKHSSDNDCDSLDEFSSTYMSTSDDFSLSNDSALVTKRTLNDYSTRNDEQHNSNNSSFSEYSFVKKLSSTVVDNQDVEISSVSSCMDDIDAFFNSSSECSKKKQRHSRSFIINLLTKKISSQNTEQHRKSIDQEMTVNNLEENKPNITNKISTITDVMDTVSTSSSELSENQLNISKNSVLNRLTTECLNQNSEGHQEMTTSNGNLVHHNTLKDKFEAKHFINGLMEKMNNCVLESSKLKVTKCQTNNNLSTTQKVSTHLSSFSETIIKPICALDNDTIWWSSDDEN